MNNLHGAFMEVGVKPPKVLLPKKMTSFWPVVACDQYTSQQDYWQRVEENAANEPSTFHLILPELYLGRFDEEERIKGIHAAMSKYMSDGILKELPEGFVLVKRNCGGTSRLGLMVLLDLEQYDFSAESTSLIRATEGTIQERIPPRLRVREGAALELPHVIVLLDDPEKTIIEPLTALSLNKLYDVELMEDGGRVEGWFLPLEQAEQVVHALKALRDKQQAPPLLFAMGDGNHSLATAKTAWEKIKKTLPEQETKDHPARFALVELENVHDSGIAFEPIHRVVFGVNPVEFLNTLSEYMKADCEFYDDEAALYADMRTEAASQRVLFHFENRFGMLHIHEPAHTLACGSLQIALDKVLMEFPQARIDYVHGDDVVKELSAAPECVGFILNALGKGELFRAVQANGPLPRKTFSMGHANEKRFYLEARRITKE